ncbi:hypothetical protein AAVH_30852 [Aphelenchoides avenae]|nr:hypothetical protein AAVH_30852 [Aphelenchus avenae]
MIVHYLQGTVTMRTTTIRPPQIEFDFSIGGLYLDDGYLRELLKGIGVTDSYSFLCTTKFSMTLTIDGHDYVIPSDVIVDKDGYMCQMLAGTPIRDVAGHGQFRIGQSFLLMFCHSLDIGNNRIGFAPNLNIACNKRQPNNHCSGSQSGP